jgi:hypothetical protein
MIDAGEAVRLELLLSLPAEVVTWLQSHMPLADVLRKWPLIEPWLRPPLIVEQRELRGDSEYL